MIRRLLHGTSRPKQRLPRLQLVTLRTKTAKNRVIFQNIKSCSFRHPHGCIITATPSHKACTLLSSQAEEPMLVHTGTPSLHFVSTPTTSSNSTRPIMQSPSFAVPPPSPPTAEVPAQLDEIWGRDLTKISLPDYVKSNSTSLSFPEKVRPPYIPYELGSHARTRSYRSGPAPFQTLFK